MAFDITRQGRMALVDEGTLLFDTENHRNDEQNTHLAQTHAIVVRKQAPELAAFWNPMAEHLDACAIKFMDYERRPIASDSSSMQALRIQAKIRFLERYRQAMWACGAVWAQMASADPPSPLKELPRSTTEATETPSPSSNHR